MILRRYMTQQVATTTALVLGFLMLMLLGGRMIRYFGIAAEGRLDIGLLFAIIGYNLPFLLELVLPLSFFIALMLVFGRLYVDHEMAVLNSSGVSRGRLARLMTPLILALFFLEAGLSIYGKPWGVRNSDSIWQKQALTSAFDLIRPQSFISSDDYHLYVGSMNDDRTELQDVILVQTASADDEDDIPADTDSIDVSTTNNVNASRASTSTNKQNSTSNEPATQNAVSQQITNSLENNEALETINNPIVPEKINKQSPLMQGNDNRDVIVLAKRAVQVENNENSQSTQLDLYQGRRYEVGTDSLIYNQVSFERYRISINKPPMDTVTDDNVTTQPLSVLWHAATGNSFASLSNTSDDQKNERQYYQQEVLPAQAELGYRLTLPWLIILAPMLAVPLAQVRPRQGRWLRLLPAIVIFTSCALVIISLKSAVTKGSLSVWIYPVTIVGFMVMALYFNWASRIHHRVRFGLGQQKSKVNNLNHDKSSGGQS